MELKRSETIGYQIRLIHNQIHKRMETMRKENEKEPLTGMQRWTLGYLSEHRDREIYQRDIEAAFHISRATASNMLSVMERRGFIERKPVEHDARLKRLVITENALGMLKQANQDIAATEQLLLQGMTTEEIVCLRKCLGIMLKNLGEDTDDGDSCQGEPAAEKLITPSKDTGDKDGCQGEPAAEKLITSSKDTGDEDGCRSEKKE